MSTKAQGDTIIAAIGDNQENTAAEARAAWNVVWNEQFLAPVREVSSGVHANTTPNSNFIYNVVIKKSGNKGFIRGTIKNSNVFLQSDGEVIFTFSNTIFNSKTSFDTVFYTGNSASGIRMQGNSMVVHNSIGASQIINFQLTYDLND